MNESLTLYSCIYPRLMRRTLFKGLILALLGITLLLYAAVELPPPRLQLLGPPLFLLSMGLITYGLLPYRKLTQLEKKPDQISLTPMSELEYYSKGQKQLMLPLKEILKITYCDSPINYGIEIWLTPELSGSTYKPAYVFYYFSKRSYLELLCWIEEESN
jgi:hypothetical protein